MKSQRTRLADARIRRVAFERYLAEAQAEEDAAELALAIAERAERAPTMRPPPPAPATPATVDEDWVEFLNQEPDDSDQWEAPW